jgi:hypothetical protein
MESSTPPCTYMDSVGSDGGGEISPEMVALLDSYRTRLDRWRIYYLHRARRWGCIYYLLLCIFIVCSTGAGVVVANSQEGNETEGIAIKWFLVAMTLTSSMCASLLAALHPVLEQQRCRERAGIAIKLRGMVFVFLSRYPLMNNRERLILQDSIVDGYSKFIDGSSQNRNNENNGTL